MIAQICLGTRCINRLRKLIRLYQSFWKLNAAYRAVFFVACPAASCDIATNDTLDWEHLKLLAHHAVSVKTLLLEKFRHIPDIYRNHMIRNNILCKIKPEL